MPCEVPALVRVSWTATLPPSAEPSTRLPLESKEAVTPVCAELALTALATCCDVARLTPDVRAAPVLLV